VPVFQGRSKFGDRDEKGEVLRQSGYEGKNTTIRDSQDWDCFSRMIAKTDLGTEGTQRLSLYTGEMC
jgi:hypothetical protein